MEKIYKSIHNPYRVVEMFEEEVAEYTEAPYAVAIDSCTDALFLCCVLNKVKEVTIPSRTYLSVPQAIMQAGGTVIFDENYDNWQGAYLLHPYPIWDCAKRFSSGIFGSNHNDEIDFTCLSFHDKKVLKIGKGGMILTNDLEAVEWLKVARYEGRKNIMYHEDSIEVMGYNMYMTPEQAARGLTLMRNIPMHTKDAIEQGGYAYLPDYPLFKNCKVIKKKELV